MHAMKLGCVGQTLAIARWSNSHEKKPRSRKSKAERRKMVETFIKKYQKSNSGNFPSLNLTHKEVGGSFYTVREIVRDLIQENKILRPGNLTSKVLTLENCAEVQETEYFSSDAVDLLTISTFGNLIDHSETQINSHFEGDLVAREETDEASNVDAVELLASDFVDISFSRLTEEHSESLEVFTKETDSCNEDIIKFSVKADANNEIHEVSASKEIEQPSASYQPVCAISSSTELMTTDYEGHGREIHDRHSYVVDTYDVQSDMKILKSSTMGTILSETEEPLDNHIDEIDQNASTKANILLQQEELNSLSMPLSDVPSQGRSDSLVLDEVTSKKGSEPAEIISLIDDQATVINRTSHMSVSSSSDSAKTEQVPDNLKVINGIESSGASFLPAVGGSRQLGDEVEHGSDIHADAKNKDNCRPKQSKTVASDGNPIVSAIRAFVAAVIKFWTE